MMHWEVFQGRVIGRLREEPQLPTLDPFDTATGFQWNPEDGVMDLCNATCTFSASHMQYPVYPDKADVQADGA
jgi:hypothetical protein